MADFSSLRRRKNRTVFSRSASLRLGHIVEVVERDAVAARAGRDAADRAPGRACGSGNFGVVTSLEYRLHPVGQVLGGMVLHPLDRAAEMLRFYRDFCPTLPDEAEAFAALLNSPEGVPMGAMLLGYNGPIEEGERVLAPARRFGQPVADLVAPMPYCARQSMLDVPYAEH